MEFWKVIEKRRSVRCYTPETVAPEQLEQVLAAGSLAPVGMGAYENVHMTVVTDVDLLEKIDRAAAAKMGNPGAHPIYGVPVMVVVSTKPGKFVIPGIESANCGCIIENMMLAATNLDLGSVYLLAATDAIKQSPELVKALNLPEGFTPTASLGLGHWAEDARKGTEDANEVKSRACRIEINHVK